MLMIADTTALLLSCCVLLFLVLLCWCTWCHMDMLLLLCWRTWKRCCCSVVKRDVKLIDIPSEFTNPPSTTPLVVESRYKSSFYHPLVVESRFTCFLLVSSSLLLLPCLNGRVTFQLFPALCCWSLLVPVEVKTQLLPSR